MEPDKKSTGQNEISLTLTREQWHTILHWLKYGADYNRANMTWWQTCCADKRTGMETAAMYERDMQQATAVCAIIDDAINIPFVYEAK